MGSEGVIGPEASSPFPAPHSGFQVLGQTAEKHSALGLRKGCLSS
jgi:hypothetical protein